MTMTEVLSGSYDSWNLASSTSAPRQPKSSSINPTLRFEVHCADKGHLIVYFIVDPAKGCDAIITVKSVVKPPGP